MASNTDNNQPILIESDDEADQQQIVPEPELPLLRDAINNASQAVLAKKLLLEVCEHNEASRELAKAMLPPLSPPAPQGTKRRAPRTEVIDRTCERCGRQFGNTTRVLRDCMHHPGELFHV